jgi:hypothetical protein
VFLTFIHVHDDGSAVPKHAVYWHNLTVEWCSVQNKYMLWCARLCLLYCNWSCLVRNLSQTSQVLCKASTYKLMQRGNTLAHTITFPLTTVSATAALEFETTSKNSHHCIGQKKYRRIYSLSVQFQSKQSTYDFTYKNNKKNS